MQFFLRLIFTVVIFTEIAVVSAQQTQVSNTVNDFDYNKVVQDYFYSNSLTDFADSSFLNSNRFLDSLLNSRLNKDYIELNKLIVSNKTYQEINKLYDFRNKIDSLNKIRIKILSDYWKRKQLQEQADTGEVNSTDSLFFDIMESLSYQDTLNIDSILQVLQPYNDTLLMAIDKIIDTYKHSGLIHWIKRMRNDTVNFYLVNINGDSMLVRLYDGNHNLIRFGLTDFWGSYTPAVIRNINKNSFKVLIDDTPEISYATDEKAKSALSKLQTRLSERVLTIKHIPVKEYVPIWILGGNTAIDISQVGMYQWAQGGDPTMSFIMGVGLFAIYKKDNQSWDNRAIFRYGVIRQGRYKNDTAATFRSNEDRLQLSSKYGYKAFGHYYVSLETDIKTQFAAIYDWDSNVKGEKESDFLSPAYITFALGLDYKPDNYTTFFLSPITSKTTVVLDTSLDIKQRYNVDYTKNVRNELGTRLKILYKRRIFDDIEIKNSLELFSNYLVKPENIDINWELNIIFPVNDFIRATITTNLIYDDDTKVPKYFINSSGIEEKYDGKGTQFREMITIGFVIKF
jgi:hypothetical protein